MEIFHDNFASAEDVFNAYAVPNDEREGIEFIFAAYDTADYEGSSHVIFRRGRVLYEVCGSHCSCNGLEECWRPEETSLVALMFRPNVSPEAKANLKQVYSNLMCFL